MADRPSGVYSERQAYSGPDGKLNKDGMIAGIKDAAAQRQDPKNTTMLDASLLQIRAQAKKNPTYWREAQQTIQARFGEFETPAQQQEAARVGQQIGIGLQTAQRPTAKATM